MRLIFSLILLIGLAPMCHAKKSNWSEYRSDNFIVYSDKKPKVIIQQIKDFEVFRKGVLAFSGLEDIKDDQRHAAIVYNSRRDYARIGPKGSAGYYTDTSSGPRMVMGPSFEDEFQEAILFHEYVHFVLKSRSNAIYPRWYNEGLAEVLGYAIVDGGKVRIGSPSAVRSQALRLPQQLSVSHLIEPDYTKSFDDVYWSKFYARSWLLVHYLQLGYLSGSEDFTARTEEYVKQFRWATDPINSFEKTLGKKVEQFDVELQRYQRRDQFIGLGFEVGVYSGEIETRRLSKLEANIFLADNAFSVGKEKQSLRYLKSLKKGKKDADRGLAIKAVLLNHKNTENKEAREIVNYIQERKLDEVEVVIDLMHYYIDQAESLDDQVKVINSDQYKRVLHLFAQGEAINDRHAGIHYWLGKLHELSGEKNKMISALEAQHSLRPRDINLKMNLAVNYFESQRHTQALPLLEYVAAWSHSVEQRNVAKELIDKINLISST